MHASTPNQNWPHHDHNRSSRFLINYKYPSGTRKADMNMKRANDTSILVGGFVKKTRWTVATSSDTRCSDQAEHERSIRNEALGYERKKLLTLAVILKRKNVSKLVIDLILKRKHKLFDITVREATESCKRCEEHTVDPRVCRVCNEYVCGFCSWDIYGTEKSICEVCNGP